jgi:hypothetical protein
MYCTVRSSIYANRFGNPPCLRPTTTEAVAGQVEVLDTKHSMHPNNLL